MAEPDPHPRAPDALPTALAVAWGSGSFCQTIIIYAFGTLLFRYLTDTAAVAAAVVGGMIALSKFYDAAINPVIGWFSDRIDTPLGRRRPWMALGGLSMAASMLLLFSVPAAASPGVKLVWITAGLFFYSNGYSLFAIPWLAMPSEMTTNAGRRTAMMAWRVGFSSLGQGAVALAGPVLLATLGMSAAAYRDMGWILAALCLSTSLGTVLATRGARTSILKTETRLPLARQLKLMATNRPFVVMVLLKAALYFGLGFSSATMALLTHWVLRLSDLWLGAYTATTTLFLVASQPLWIALGRARGRRFAFSVALLAYVLSLLSLYFNTGSAPILLLQAIPMGAASGGIFMLSQSLLPDVIEHDHRRAGVRSGGAYAGVVSLLETASAATAIFLLGLVLSRAGYVQGLAAGGRQPAGAIAAIRLSASVIPAAAELLALFALAWYRLEPDRPSPGRSIARSSHAIAPIATDAVP